MKNLTVLKPSLAKFILAIMLLVLVTTIACESSEETQTGISTEDLQCPGLEETPQVGDVPLGPPPALPNIFTGTAYVNGEPAPEGEQLYVKLVTSRSHAVQIEQNGKFINIIHGPVSDQDKGVPFQFCLGDPEGVAVKSAETFEFDGSEPFKTSDVELNFPMLPSELSSQ